MQQLYIPPGSASRGQTENCWKIEPLEEQGRSYHSIICQFCHNLFKLWIKLIYLLTKLVHFLVENYKLYDYARKTKFPGRFSHPTFCVFQIGFGVGTGLSAVWRVLIRRK